MSSEAIYRIGPDRRKLAHQKPPILRLLLLEPRGYPCQNVNYATDSALSSCEGIVRTKVVNFMPDQRDACRIP